LNLSLIVFLSSLAVPFLCLRSLYASPDAGEKAGVGSLLGKKGKRFMIKFLSPVTEFSTVVERFHAFANMPPTPNSSELSQDFFDVRSASF
jgi:hypothetical protein